MRDLNDRLNAASMGALVVALACPRELRSVADAAFVAAMALAIGSVVLAAMRVGRRAAFWRPSLDGVVMLAVLGLLCALLAVSPDPEARRGFGAVVAFLLTGMIHDALVPAEVR